MSTDSFRYGSHDGIIDQYGIIGTPPEPIFDDLTATAACLCRTPIAVLAVMDQRRAWFKSRVGLNLDSVALEHSFFTHTVQPGNVFIVPDTICEPTFHHNPMVTGVPFIRFYAGASIVRPDGISIGTLCVMDRIPRQLTQDQCEAVRSLARHASDLLELRRAALQATRGEHPTSKAHDSSILFDFVPTPLMVCSASKFSIVEANISALNLYGYDREEFCGMPIRDLFLSDSEFRLPEDNQSVLVFHRTKNGEVLKVELTARRVVQLGETVYLISIQEHDLEVETSKPKIEVPLVCHELRQPLTSIHSSLGYLSAEYFRDASPDSRKILEIAYRNTQRMLRLVNDLQETSALSLGITRMSPEDLNLNDVVREAIESSQSKAFESESRVVFAGSFPGAMVRGDRDRLIQVFSNLFSNALRFTPPGKPVVVSITREGVNLEVQVRDHGPGIPVEVQRQLFEGMVRGDRRRNKQNSGLGLYICRLILDAMGGSIRFETDENSGTTFFVSLPSL
ncbi:MAG TPA: ATP-binding protein [Acidobacteriota bacterium]|nr:ATP-binding protein [Acidobacteriota bacterium]